MKYRKIQNFYHKYRKRQPKIEIQKNTEIQASITCLRYIKKQKFQEMKYFNINTSNLEEYCSVKNVFLRFVVLKKTFLKSRHTIQHESQSQRLVRALQITTSSISSNTIFNHFKKVEWKNARPVFYNIQHPMYITVSSL